MQRRAAAPVFLHGTPTVPPTELPQANPFGTWLLEMGFDLFLCSAYRREIVLPEDFHIAPGTLIASNHQRDVDGPMLGTLLVQRRGLRFKWPLPFYAAREDLFRPGILSRLTVHWPRPLSALLGHVSLAWFFPLGHAEPMRRVREFTLGEALRALLDAGCGDADCASLLNARGRRELAVTPGASLRDVLERAGARLEAWWGLRRLTLPALHRIAPAFRTAVAAQLAHFTRRLDRGDSVYYAPEGTISMDGHFSRIRAGFFRLARAAEIPPWIQPMALSYDSLSPGRTRVVLRIGRHFRADTSLDRRAFDAALRRSILSLAPITPSHLLAHFLLHGPAHFTRDELAGWLARNLASLSAKDASLDPLWSRVAIPALARRRLRWLVRKRLVARDGNGFRNLCPRDAEAGWRHPANVVRYLDNGLADLAPDLHRC